jgi:predicted Ser/Thr protein kinase
MSNIITFDKVDDLELSPVLLESFVAHGKKHHKFVDEESLSYFDALLNGWRKEFKRQAEGVKKYYVSQGESEKNASEIAKGYLKYIVAFPEEREKLNESSGYRYLNICAMLLNYHDKAPSWTKKIPY